MPIASYDDLKSEVQSWMLDRTDLASDVDTFISLAEADFNDVIRTREMEATASLTAGVGGTFPLPADFVQLRTAAPANGLPLDLVSTDFVETEQWRGTVGTPKYVYIEGNQITVNPSTGLKLDFRYYRKIPALSDTNQTNWLLLRRPGAYLFACCAYAATFLRDEATAQMMFGLTGGELEKLGMADARNRWAKGTRQVRGVRP